MEKKSTQKVAIVTGANRGLGLATAQSLRAQGFQVISACRKVFEGVGPIEELDVSDLKSVENFCNRIEAKWGAVDVLVNNAGVYLDRAGGIPEPDLLQKTWQTNVIGAYEMCRRLLPSMAKNKSGRVVNVSSGMGQLSQMGSGSMAYRVSKTALNAVTKVLSEEYKTQGILINAVCPGWVKTDMGGAGATRSLEEGIDTIVWAATLPEDGPSGGFFRDRKAIPW